MEKVLKSGKKIEMKELKALEEVLSYQIMGKLFDTDNVAPTAILHRSVCAVLSLVKIDDEPVRTPASMDDVYVVLNKFGKKEWAEALDLYSELNEAEDELGE